jgi:tripartite-type tricarboxylate transporter receptor subunit TctC
MAIYRSATVALALAGMLAVPPARAQDYPNRPVHLIVPYAPGGGADIVARLVAPKLTEAWGQPVVVDNKPGANGIVASEYAMQQPADGYTIVVGTLGSHGIMQYLNPNLGYNPLHDFTGITALVYSPLICLVAPLSPFRIMKELVDYARTTAMPFGSPGVGSQMHLIGEMFNLLYGTKFQHVAYRGVAPAMQDLIGGHIPMVMGEMGSSKPLVASGQLRALALTGTQRNPSLPDVPTFTEAGYPNFEVNSWFALFVPVATPRLVIDKIAADVTKVVHSPDISKRFADDGWVPGGGTPEDLQKLWIKTSQQLGDVIRQRHITLQ